MIISRLKNINTTKGWQAKLYPLRKYRRGMLSETLLKAALFMNYVTSQFNVILVSTFKTLCQKKCMR